ncbi:MAG: alpha-L-arabinofuranosidase [Clostridia bacterium]|nr:alpha-L-arabinofuranosidase [Clostridia bacterium]
MKKATITLHPAYRVGEVSPRLFGAFLEPIGSMVNGSMFNPKHPTADEQGFRRDYIDGLKEAGLPCVRLPGGNFVSGWSWKDSIGPMEKRKTRLDPAWFQYIPNDVGHDEYLQWCEKVGAEPMYTINLGTGTLQDAMDIVEYTNFESGSTWADMRRANGHEKPYGVKIWYLGNEMDGPWQIGSYERDPKGYGVLAHEASKVMKWIDPTIETVACVSSSPFLNHYPDWDETVLQECYETVDYISLHHYHSAPPGNIPALMAGAMAFEDYIHTEIALCDLVKTRQRVKKTMMLSLDEYACSYRPVQGAHLGLGGRQPAMGFLGMDPKRKYVRHDPDDWSTRRAFPKQGEMPRTLANAAVMLVMLRHADRIKIGCATSGLAMLCATNREHAWKSAAYYPMTQLMRYARGVSLQTVTESETFNVDGYAIDDMNQYGGFTDVPYVQSAAVLNEEAGEMTVFVINGDEYDAHALTLDAAAFAGWTFTEHVALFTDDPEAYNDDEHPETIVPVQEKETSCTGGVVQATLRPLSWNMLRFERKPDA